MTVVTGRYHIENWPTPGLTNVRLYNSLRTDILRDLSSSFPPFAQKREGLGILRLPLCAC